MVTQNLKIKHHKYSGCQTSQSIDVSAVFKRGKIVPKCFIWEGRKYVIKEIESNWQDQIGSDILHYYAVSDGDCMYNIYFNNRYFNWHLASTYRK